MLPLTLGRGESFYRNKMHFVLTLERAARRFKHKRDHGLERIALIVVGVMLVASMFLQDRGLWSFKIPLGDRGFDLHLVGLAILLAWMLSYHARVGKLRRSIIDRKRCLNCGKDLLRTPTDKRGVGRCRSCGMEFNKGWYDLPGG